MRNSMSVPEVVREIITRNRSIYDCMKMDLINYTALAVKIQQEVERLLGGPVNLNTIVVAIKRYSDSFESKQEIENERVLKDARLTLIDGIMDIKLPIEFAADPKYLMDKLAQISPDYEFFRLADTFRVLTEDIVEIRNFFESLPNSESQFNTGLAKIKIFIPESENRSGVASFVTEILHNNGIEYIDAYFSQDNIIIVLKGNDTSRAYEILRSEIAR